MSDLVAASFSAQFTLLDWGVVIVYMAVTTWLGVKLAGKQATIRDFFLGGRQLPWYAVSGSIVATEISAVTFVGAPYIVFKDGGNFTYLQLGLIGTLLARIIVGYVLIPAYYRREIYSPYDYIGHQLGGNTRGVATSLFALGGMLAQSARVYLTALVLTVVLSDQLTVLSNWLGADPLAWAIILISLVAVAWTLVGGITTVIWTDVMLFLMFVGGAVIALGTLCYELDGGFADIVRAGWSARTSDVWWDWGKFTFFNFEHSWPAILTNPYTIWSAVIAATWGSLGPYGTDQLIVQRMFCCRNEKEARWAIISSTAGQIVTLIVMVIGVGLYAFYQQHQMRGEALELFKKEPNRVFPIFIVDAVPVFFKGTLVAAIFAAAISSLTSILAALSQTTMSAFYTPLRQKHLERTGCAVPTPAAADQPTAEDRRSVLVGRVLILAWGVVLAVLAYFIQELAAIFPEILNLALAMAGFTGGALLAGFALGFLPLKIDGWGYQFSAPLSVLCVFAIVFHSGWSHVVCIVCGALLALWWLIAALAADSTARPHMPRVAQALALLAGIAGVLWISYQGYFGATTRPDGSVSYVILSWPWYVPVGSTVAFAWGVLLAHRRDTPAEGTRSRSTLNG